ncbi:MAG: radical SAM protein [archaeon]
MLFQLPPPYETGPYRPPNEGRSLLIRVNRNCSWNRCSFCPLFKEASYEERPVEEILADVDTAAKHYEELGRMPKTGFLQDADPLSMKTDDLVKVLRRIRERFPNMERITAYARSSTLANRPVDEWRELREAGLTRVHRGLESGYDPLLRYMQKGATARTHIIGGQRVKQGGVELSDYVMPGLGGNLELEPGKPTWKEHALETARVLNEINPDYIRLRTLAIDPESPLAEKEANEGYRRLSDPEIMQEIRLFIESLQVTETELESVHTVNILMEVGGKLPEDKEKMFVSIDRYLAMPTQDQLFFRLGVFLGYIYSDFPLFNTLEQFHRPEVKELLEKAIPQFLEHEGLTAEECIDGFLRRQI